MDCLLVKLIGKLKESISTLIYCSRRGSLTCTRFEINIGSIDMGNRRMLKRDNETKAVEAVSWLFSSTRTYVANVTKAT